jgi:hypothetical protein
MDDVRTLLKRIRRERHELRVVQESAAELRGMLLPAGIRYDKDKVQTSPEEKMSGIVADLIRIEETQSVLVDRLSNDILLAEQLIGAMPTPEYRELIRFRFIYGGLKPLTWEQVAEKMEYSSDHVRGHLYDKAITEAIRVWTQLNTP